MSNKLKKDPRSYRRRKYRQIPVTEGMRSCLVQVRETDLQIMAPVDVIEAATHLLIQERNRLENYIAWHREFLEALQPLADDPTAPALFEEPPMGIVPAYGTGAAAEFIILSKAEQQHHRQQARHPNQKRQSKLSSIVDSFIEDSVKTRDLGI